ncbi:hypothetical protein GS489_07175 [Rhodococcus hoagii]|nr:hypothetical protein [Prescottella equi]
MVAGGSSYPLLARLEKAGLVESESRRSESGPPRKYYSLTALGQSALEEGTSEWSSVARSVTALLTPTAETTSGRKQHEREQLGAHGKYHRTLLGRRFAKLNASGAALRCALGPPCTARGAVGRNSPRPARTV